MDEPLELIFGTHKDLVIQDVNEKWHENVRDFMMGRYFMRHPIYTFLEYNEDPDAKKEFSRFVDHILRDECSVIALHKDTNEIYAVALLKCMIEDFKSWTCLQYCIGTSMFADVVELQARAMEDYAADDPKLMYSNLHIFAYFIDDELKEDDEFLRKCFDAVYRTAQVMKMSRITCLAMSEADQERAYSIKFERIGRSIYSMFRYRKQRPFACLRQVHETEAGLFEFPVVPLPSYETIIVRNYEYIDELQSKKGKT